MRNLRVRLAPAGAGNDLPGLILEFLGSVNSAIWLSTSLCGKLQDLIRMAGGERLLSLIVDRLRGF